VAEDTPADAGSVSALATWGRLVQEQLDAGQSTLNAYEAVDRAYPGLWAAAVAEQARQPQQAPGAGSGGRRPLTPARPRLPRPWGLKEQEGGLRP
jgi:hypothetical protein